MTDTTTPFPSLLHAARSMGYRSNESAWLDQETGVLAKGTLNDNALSDPAARYGNPGGLRAKGWPPDQYVGSHSSQNPHTLEYAYKVLPAFVDGKNVEGIGNRDRGDLNFAVGLTTFINHLAKEKGLMEDPHGTPKPVEPRESAAAAALATIVAEATKARALLPFTGGGKPVNDFRRFIDFVLKTSTAANATTAGETKTT